MMRNGINPKGASPARRRSERTNAGRMDVDELVPGRGPLDQQLAERRDVRIDCLFEF